MVETTKASIEISAPGDGTLCRVSREGEEVELGHSVGFVAESADELAAIGSAPDPKPKPAVRSGTPNATKKAIDLAEAHGVDLGSIEKEGFITAEDVEALVAAQAAAARPAAAADHRLAGTSTEGVTLPASFGLGDAAGRVDEAFLDSLRTDPEAFRALSSEERCAAYREHGAEVGADVELGARTLVVSPQIVIGDGVTIGDGALVRCHEIFAAGALTQFGAGFELTCRRAYFGENGYIGRGARIGGGGNRDPWATFAAGDLVFIGEEAFVNPCRPVLIGREVFLTMRSVIVTHNVGHSLLEGFENRFAPVVLEDRSQIGIGTIVYAGCRVGREAIVASNSYVVSDIPAGKLAAGVPARVTGSAFHPLSRERQGRLLERMIDELEELLELRGIDASALAGPTRGVEVRHDGATSLVLAVEKLGKGFEPPEADGETVVLTLELAGGPPPGCAVLDLLGRRVYGDGGVMLDSVREFCRKRGIRFEPGPWRYSGGLV